ncbi:hypothetical protein TUBRATIS_29200 [Tubulinosema ratisbonensis]|uniref:Uncharacterized protein n=1 Tax=Tubulinosema ratisbonensis TaxID=291195 RepID=A0A437AHM5_9MICR|nr:hypothetical protein TUBRATIS_29200 [Tubulinosema ratisbonensis]
MEELKNIIEEIKQDKSEEELLNLEIKEKKLFNKLKELEKEKETYSILLKNLKIDKKEEEIRELSTKIGNINLLHNKLNTLEDFLIFSDTYLQKEILEEKIENFLQKNLVLKQLNEKKILCIYKKIEESLVEKVNSELIKEIFELVLKKKLETFDFEWLNLCEFGEFIGLVFSCDSFEEDIPFKGLISQIEFCKIQEELPEIEKLICKVIKDKLMKSIKEENFNYEKMSDFNESNKNTSLFVKSFDDLTLDYCVKEIIKISKTEPNLILEENDNLFYTKDTEKILKLYLLIQKNKSKRNLQGRKMAQKSILKYFSNETNTDILYIYFNNLNFLQKKIEDDFLQRNFSEIKENIFDKIIKKESLINFKNSDLQELKIKINDFEKKLEKYFKGKNVFLFKITFFEKSFDNFLNYIFNLENLTRNEAMNESFKCEYLIQQCSLPSSDIVNYKKIEMIKNLLRGCNLFHRENLMNYFDLNELLRLLQVMPWFEELEEYLNK